MATTLSNLIGLSNTAIVSSNQTANQTSTDIAVPIPSADGNGLPFNKISSNNDARFKRNIIHWFIPEFGVVRMFNNPEGIGYRNKKLVPKTRTKGGYSIQYWGEELTTLSISGTTGSSGVEGINVLYEMYRAEQYAFDSVGLTLAANNATIGAAQQIFNGIGDSIGSTAGDVTSGLLNSLAGTNSYQNSLAPSNIPTLASIAFGIEMYYDGWVYRGFFENFNFDEKSSNFLWSYNFDFTVTQRRGYRTNYLPWQKSAKDGPSQYNTPNSFSGRLSGQ